MSDIKSMEPQTTDKQRNPRSTLRGRLQSLPPAPMSSMGAVAATGPDRTATPHLSFRLSERADQSLIKLKALGLGMVEPRARRYRRAD